VHFYKSILITVHTQSVGRRMQSFYVRRTTSTLQSEDAGADLTDLDMCPARSVLHCMVGLSKLTRSFCADIDVLHISLLTFPFVYYKEQWQLQRRGASRPMHDGLMCAKLSWVCTYRDCMQAIVDLRSYRHSPKMPGCAMRKHAEDGLPPIFLDGRAWSGQRILGGRQANALGPGRALNRSEVGAVTRNV
jgi:hypothetical protein